MKHVPGFPGGATSVSDFPAWVPGDARAYLEHTHRGLPMRAVARATGCHASTVLRHVRRLESRRDDPLVDEALTALGSGRSAIFQLNSESASLMNQNSAIEPIANDHDIESEARRILRRLCESGAFLIVSQAMIRAAVMREATPGKPVRIAVVDRAVVQAFALNDWIACYRKGKIARYQITCAGRSALKRLLAESRNTPRQDSLHEATSPFQEQHKDWQTRDDPARVGENSRRLRYNLAESPLTALGRRKGRDGAHFLTPELVQAGERLREDFEMAQMGPRVTQNWDRFLTVGQSHGAQSHAPASGPRAARERVARALRDLGPGLGDIALRCCCFLEGMETAEKRMGWSARSGKIVLRIALQRLKTHYETSQGTLSPMIG